MASYFNQANKPRLIFSTVPIFFKRDRHIIDNEIGVDLCEKSIAGGALLNLRYLNGKSWWIEATTAIEKESLKTNGNIIINKSKFGFDDIVISSGYNFKPTDNLQIVLFGISGIPTTRKITIEERFNSLVGTRFFSLGVGTEFSYAFINSLKRSLIFIFQNRFLHFFNRNWSPILPENNSEIQPGNATDLLLTLQYRHKKNIFEIGYNPTFLTNSAVIINNKEIKADSFLRNNFYCSYTRFFEKIPLINKPFVLGSGISIGTSKRFETRILIWWVNLTLVF